MRYLGVDPGGRRMGLALGDDLTGIATPLEVLPCRGADHAVELIADRARRHRAGRIVIGRPADADGNPTPACARSEAIARGLRDRQLAVELQNEFLSTDEARRRARDSGLAPGQPVDHIAAQVLLEEYLAAHRAPEGEGPGCG